jgi:hypothetical protein
MLATIVIPAAIVVVIVIGTTLWYFGRRSPTRRLEPKHHIDTSYKPNHSHHSSSSIITSHRHHGGHGHGAVNHVSGGRKGGTSRILVNASNVSTSGPICHPNDNFLNRLNPSCIYKKLNTFSYKLKKPDGTTLVIDDSAGKYASIFNNSSRSNLNVTSNPNTTNYKEISAIGYSSDNKGFFHEQECQIATDSRSTFASHFEDNNWDYNFATRGLYFSQPWVRGRYTHTLGSESMPYSGALTLDPATDLSESVAISNNPNAPAANEQKTKNVKLESDKKKKSKNSVDMYGANNMTDSEGYYA